MTTESTLRVVSFGGGVQSTALLVLAAQGDIDFQTFIFANVGEDSEHPDTLKYVEEYARPYAEAHGVQFAEVRRTWKDGRDWTLYRQLMQRETKSIGIPIRMASGPPGLRNCTTSYKIDPIAKWLKGLGWTAKSPGVVGLGISLDEMQRMRTDSGHAHYTLEYPLVQLRLDRSNCMGIIERAGLPVPPKSSCWFCPFHSLRAWREMRDQRPDLFEKSVELEKMLNVKRGDMARDAVYLTDALVPLEKAVGPHTQLDLFSDESDSCESGYCMT